MSEQTAQAEAIVADYVACNEAYVRVKAERDAAKDKLLSLFPKEAGEHEVIAGNWRATVTYPDKMKWDSEELAAIYGADVPPHVKRVLSIDATAYRRLPLEEREQLAKCFTPALGSPKIEVEVK